ncbi:hypothetical protein IGB42_01452 [Andreprevotia sp. IGB-42]|uniref:NirD/YgiW/YdeI family stress tolerance protein n=1 Tax=Andreprevotia sp. IGB-42 TaxID=2497473 RepID=UPI00157E36ED|nr:NirD/YgiW/YdeI family stress tolerance protein [Andreprevotia sp. IGB-42]KAF0813773.1 hypothetical protein IGB42_01452 [Andreprevotia sp. IGB-42]
MNKIIGLIAVLTMGVAAAAYVGPGGAKTATLTAVEAAKAADDTAVALEGRIIRKIDKDHYEFQDASGTIRIEVDQKNWPAGDIGPDTRVRLTGEVDQGWRGVDVDVDVVEILR